MSVTMTSLERVLTTLGHQEPDRVPLFLLTTMQGAREIGVSIEEYFSRAEFVIEGQLRLRHKYDTDCVSAFFYASIEIEAWGGKTIFSQEGPPNCGAPIIVDPEMITDLKPPPVADCPRLNTVLDTIRGLKKAVQDEVPIIGVVISPFSLPVMQLGYPNYLDLMSDRPELFTKLMACNEKFSTDWANAQLEAGATAICYFDPLASSTNTPPLIYRQTGFKSACRTLAQINGPTATHLASGRVLPVIDDLAATGTAIVGVGCLENLAEIKTACRNKLTVLGNLNGVAMRNWSAAEAEKTVKDAIAAAGPGGGFILSDGHGEIPWQVPDEVLHAICDATRTWGRYPLDWVDDYGD